MLRRDPNSNSRHLANVMPTQIGHCAIHQRVLDPEKSSVILYVNELRWHNMF